MLAMKKLILILAVVAFATTAWAQETPKKPSFAGFVSNGFWDNWEMSLGGGVGTALTNGSNSGSFGKRLGFEANFSLVKWVHPVVGMRLQLQGGQFANYDADLGKLKWPYLFVHSDFMLNFSNWAGGYRDDRAYYLVPFVGFGYLATNFTDKSQEDNMTGTHQAFAFSYGLLNKFRLSRSFDFNIELKGMLAPSRVCPAKTDGSYLFGFSATAGFTYRFNKRGWQRGVAGYTAADIQAFQDAVAASMAAVEAAELENAQLAQQLAAGSGAGCRRSERRRRCRGSCCRRNGCRRRRSRFGRHFDHSLRLQHVGADAAGEDASGADRRADQERLEGCRLPDRGSRRPADGYRCRQQARRRAPRQAGLRLPRIEGRESQAVELRG